MLDGDHGLFRRSVCLCGATFRGFGLLSVNVFGDCCGKLGSCRDIVMLSHYIICSRIAVSRGYKRDRREFSVQVVCRLLSAVNSQHFLSSKARSRRTPLHAKGPCGRSHDLAAPFLCLIPSAFAVAVESTPCAASVVSFNSFFNSLISFSLSSVSSSLGSYSLRSSSAVLYKTNRTAIRQIKKNQKRLTACRLARSAKVMYCAIQHLYC